MVRGSTSRPDSYKIKRYAHPTEETLHSDADDEWLEDENHSMKFDGVGWNWEADEVARCLKGVQGRSAG